jgi:hypothetical protein
MTGGVIRTKSEDLDTYRMSLESIKAASLNPSASIQLISAIARGEG